MENFAYGRKVSLLRTPSMRHSSNSQTIKPQKITDKESVKTNLNGVFRREERYGYSETTYVEGEKHGLFKGYYPNGTLRQICSYRNNVKEGREIRYWPNGVKKMNANFNNGSLEGEYEEWDEAGNLVCTKSYFKGKLVVAKGSSSIQL